MRENPVALILQPEFLNNTKMSKNKPSTQIASIRFDGESFTVSEEMLIEKKSNKIVFYSIIMILGFLYCFDQTILFLMFKWLISLMLFLASGLWIFSKVGGKCVSARLISFVLDQVMSRIDKRFSRIRKELLKSVCGNVLDFGSGTGIYLEYLTKPTVTSVHIMEPNLHQHRHIKKRISALPNLPNALMLTSSFIESFADSQVFDWVILGNVFCEIPHPAATFIEIDRVLKPGGRVYFSEHIAYPRNTWLRTLQNVINPYWSVVTDGCNCNRDTLEVMKATLPQWEVLSWEFDGGTFPWIGRFVVGLCVKK
jgi:SAM-dependent methyltransferase